MKLKFQLTEEDFLAFQLYTSNQSPIHRKRRFRSRVIVPIAYIGFGLYSYFTKGHLGVLLVFMGLAIVWYYAYPFYQAWSYKRLFKRNIAANYGNRVYTDIDVEFKPETVTAIDKSSTSEIKADQFTELIEIKDHFFVKLITNESLIIPKKAVEAPEELKELIVSYGAKYTDALDWKWK